MKIAISYPPIVNDHGQKAMVSQNRNVQFFKEPTYLLPVTYAQAATDLKQMDLSRRALQVCYELLPKHMKSMAKLRFQEEKSLLQISKVLKRPMGSVSATLHRIRINLIACVKEKIPAIEADLDS